MTTNSETSDLDFYNNMNKIRSVSVDDSRKYKWIGFCLLRFSVFKTEEHICPSFYWITNNITQTFHTRKAERPRSFVESRLP